MCPGLVICAPHAWQPLFPGWHPLLLAPTWYVRIMQCILYICKNVDCIHQVKSPSNFLQKLNKVLFLLKFFLFNFSHDTLMESLVKWFYLFLLGWCFTQTFHLMDSSRHYGRREPYGGQRKPTTISGVAARPSHVWLKRKSNELD